MDCIRLNGYEKKKLSKNNARLRGLAPDFIGGEAVFQVDVLKVVEVNGSGIIQRHIKVIRIAAEQRHGRGGLLHAFSFSKNLLKYIIVKHIR